MNPHHLEPTCPLCKNSTRWFHSDRRRHYYQCPTCALVHVPKDWQLDATAEKAVYDQHQNIPDDPDYRQFLSRLADPLLSKLPPASQGLDFGCGPGPALAAMLSEAGHSMALYDLYYFPRPEVFGQQWDFITATEVVEHLADPQRELQRLWGCLKPGGWLGIMTKRVEDPAAFGNWHYKNDPTHISFFAASTFAWLAQQWEAEVEFCGRDTVLIQKRP
ncbi:MAG: class I SAM-dependent methyltransferase [Pseudomonas sp.]